MSLCKYCEQVDIVWPENYVKGMKPIETETGIEHNMERCHELQNVNIVKKDGWIKRICNECKSFVMFSRKHYTEKTSAICNDCCFNMNTF